MKKLITALLLIPILSFGQSITQHQIDSLKALNDLKYKFTVSFDRMMYEYEIRKSYEKTDSLQKAIIVTYEQITGIQARGTEELKEAYNTRVEAERLSDLAAASCLEDLKKQTRRRKAWKTVSIVGIPVALGVGVYVGMLIL